MGGQIKANIINCTITGNSVTVGGDGGGIYLLLSSGEVNVVTCSVTGNSAGLGGGIYYETEYEEGSDNISLSVRDCNISGNSAHMVDEDEEDWGDGGGIYVDARGLPNDINIVNCTINGNSAAWDGGIVCGDSNSTITNCTIINNIGDGGITCWGGMSILNNNLVVDNSWGGIYLIENASTIRNNTIVENRGSGIYLEDVPSATVTNCIVRGNSIDDNERQISLFHDVWYQVPTVLYVSYSNIQGGEAGIYQDPNCTLSWGAGNLDADPCFVKNGYWDPNGTPDDANDDFWVEGDYHLLPHSPCIDAGDPNYPVDTNEFDIDGDRRIIGGRIDIGADEYAFGELSDFNGDGVVNFNDFAILAYYWADFLCTDPDWCEGCDYDQSGEVDIEDLKTFAENWLWQSN